MNRLFGYSNRKTGDQLLQESSRAMDQAQQSLGTRIAQLDTQIAQLNAQLQVLQRKIASSGSGGGPKPLRDRALKLLNKRRQLESMRDQLDSQSWSMSQAQMTTENLKNTMVTVNALKQTSKTLKKQYNKINIDKIQEMQDEMSELIEQGEELQQVLAMNGESLDEVSEGELDAELEALGEGNLDFMIDEGGLSESIPSYLNSAAPPQFIDEEEPSTQETTKLAAT